MKILVVDDEKFNLAMARDIINRTVDHCEVVLCDSPDKVEAILAEADIDIVLLDIIMPKINGIEVLKMIRSNDAYKNIQIIMFTGLTDSESFRLCFEHGANDYVNKPINVVEFTARVRAAVKARNNMLMLREMFNKVTEHYNELQAVTQKLQETQVHLVQSEKLASLGEIAAGVAHEINNPIGFIGSNLGSMEKYLTKIRTMLAAYRDFLARLEEDGAGRRDLQADIAAIRELESKQKIDMVLEDLGPLIEESKSGVERVAKIVQSLRNFARTGKEDEMALNDLNQIVEESLLIIRNEIKYNINLTKNLQTLPPVICDKSQIGQVLINILVNASQAIKSLNREDKGNITVETYQDGNYVVCRLSDDGPGIKKEHLGRIFDPFFTTKEVGSGTGLGLSIGYGIVKKHGGELLAESEPGKGAAFIVKLPVRNEFGAFTEG